MSVGQTRDSHSETMAKKVVRAEIGLLRDDWFLPVLKAAIDRALMAVDQGKHYRIAASEALAETYADFGLEGITALIGTADHKAIEAGEREGQAA